MGERLRTILQGVADDNGWSILELAIQADHVHLVVEVTPREAPYQIANAFKGRSSRLLRKEFAHLLKLPSLWTRSYFVASIGHVSAQTMERYIQAQTE